MDLASRDSYIQKLASKVVSQREQEPKKKPFGNVSPSVLFSCYDIISWQLCFGFVNACWNAQFIVCRVSYSHVNTHYCYSPKMALRCLWSSCWWKSIVWRFKLRSLYWYFYHPDYLFVVLYVQSHLCTCNSPARSLNVFKCIIFIAAMTSETVEWLVCSVFFVCLFSAHFKGTNANGTAKKKKKPKKRNFKENDTGVKSPPPKAQQQKPPASTKQAEKAPAKQTSPGTKSINGSSLQAPKGN